MEQEEFDKLPKAYLVKDRYSYFVECRIVKRTSCYVYAAFRVGTRIYKSRLDKEDVVETLAEARSLALDRIDKRVSQLYGQIDEVRGAAFDIANSLGEIEKTFHRFRDWRTCDAVNMQAQYRTILMDPLEE